MGKLIKFYAENCLLHQEFVKDGSMSVEKYIASAAKALGGTVTFKDAVRFEKGEGIEKKQEDFAAEVAAQMNAGHYALISHTPAARRQRAYFAQAVSGQAEQRPDR